MIAASFFEKLLPRVASMPGVTQASMVSNTPGEGGQGWDFEIQGHPAADGTRRPAAITVAADKSYLSMIGLRLLRGKDFEDNDGLPGKETVIVMQSFAAKNFPNRDELGKQIRLFDRDGKPNPWMTIVGVSPDFRQQNAQNHTADPVFLLPYKYAGNSSMRLLLKTNTTPATLTNGLRSAVQQIDQDLPLFEIMTVSEGLARQIWYLRVFGSLFLIFAMVAMGMAAVGIYAVMANDASRRTREIGVRMALGASVGAILALLLRRGAIQLGLGMVLGLGAAFGATRLMASMLFNISPSDPITFVAVALTLSAAGLAAVYFPARKAAKLDPLNALRYE